MDKKKGFRGKPYLVSFEHRQETFEEIFGNKPLTTAEMTKKLWSFIKTKGLGFKSD